MIDYLVKEWDVKLNGGKKPEDYSRGSTQMITWRCSKNNKHIWNTRIKYRTREINKTGCPICVPKHSKVSIKWLEYLIQIENIDIEHAKNFKEFSIKNNLTGCYYNADGYCRNTNTVYEYNGCYYHGCLKCYKNRDEINIEAGKTFEELYNKTITKRILFKIRL